MDKALCVALILVALLLFAHASQGVWRERTLAELRSLRQQDR